MTYLSLCGSHVRLLFLQVGKEDAETKVSIKKQNAYKHIQPYTDHWHHTYSPYSTHDFIIHLLLKSPVDIAISSDFRLLFKDEVRALGGTSQQKFSGTCHLL